MKRCRNSGFVALKEYPVETRTTVAMHAAAEPVLVVTNPIARI